MSLLSKDVSSCDRLTRTVLFVFIVAQLFCPISWGMRVVSDKHVSWFWWIQRELRKRVSLVSSDIHLLHKFSFLPMNFLRDFHANKGLYERKKVQIHYNTVTAEENNGITAMFNNWIDLRRKRETLEGTHSIFSITSFPLSEESISWKRQPFMMRHKPTSSFKSHEQEDQVFMSCTMNRMDNVRLVCCFVTQYGFGFFDRNTQFNIIFR